MNEEEIKAIEKLKWYFEESNSLDIAEQTYIVLNLIEKQKAEINNLKWKNEIYVKSIKSHNRYQIELNDEIIEKNNKIFDLEAEIEKKDKIINEMAEYIDEITEEIAREKGVGDFEFCDNKCTDKDEYIECKQCIKEYFENKVKESK